MRFLSPHCGMREIPRYQDLTMSNINMQNETLHRCVPAASPMKYLKERLWKASCCQPSNCLIIHSKDSAANTKG